VLDPIDQVIRGKEGGEGLDSFIEGMTEGDWTKNQSWSALGGQFFSGELPIVGLLADIRDAAASVWDYMNGNGTIWSVFLSVGMFVPGGSLLKKGGSWFLKRYRRLIGGAAESAGKQVLGKIASEIDPNNSTVSFTASACSSVAA
jgi:hypothetical protein